MNKNLYRIVFNKARGLLMVVADIARSGRAGAARSSGLGHTLSRCISKLCAVSFSLWLALGMVQPVNAAVVADGSAPGNQQPTVIGSANGTPQVNIQTPSAGGVSRNVYSQFDVDKKGVILNNSHKNVNTELGGMVSGNPWLAKGEAKIILNEVNARDPSRLNGMVEVAGQKAQVIIANPSGITCNGCGFINANRGTLTTGQAQMNNGNLTGFNVERGEVVIEGAGMDSSRQDYTDIIARSVKINAKLWANDLQVTTGRNQVDAAHQNISAQADDPATKPQLAVDVSSLGGMYAGKIRLIGTEQGVGVRNAGKMGAEAGSVVVTADGRIENSGSITGSESVALASKRGVSNSGGVFAKGSTTVTTPGDIDNSGSIAAGKRVQIQAGSLNSRSGSMLMAGVNEDGTAGGAGDLVVNTQGQLTAQGKNVATGNLTARGQGIDVRGSRTIAKTVTLDAQQKTLQTAGAQVAAEQQLNLNTASQLNNDGGSLSANQLTLNAQSLSNQQGDITQFGTDDLTFNLPGSLNNNAGHIASNGNLFLTSSTLDNQNGEVAAAQSGNLNVQTVGAVNNTQGMLAAGKGLTLGSNQLTNDGGLLQSGADMALDTRGGLLSNLNSGDGNGIISRGGLTLSTGNLDNRQGFIASAQDLTLTGAALDNRGGTLGSEQALTSTTKAVNNQGGAIKSGQGMTLNTQGERLDNSQKGVIAAGQSLQLDSGDLLNSNGTLVSGTDAVLTFAQLDNRAGQLAAQGALNLTGKHITNDDGGLIQSGATLTLRSDSLSNRNSGETGGITSLGDMHLTTGAFDNNAGVLIAGNNLNLTSAAVDNLAGQLVAQKALIANTQAVDNRGGLVQSGELLYWNSQLAALNNAQGTFHSLGGMQLSTGELNNQNGTLGAKGDFTLTASKVDNSAAGRIIGEQALTITTADLNNQQGQVQAVGDLLLSSAQGVIDNALGLLRSGATVTLNALTFLNQNTQGDNQGLEGQTVVVNSDRLDNQSGSILANKQLNITNRGVLNNNSGQLASAELLQLQGDNLALQNSAGMVKAGKQLDIKALSVGGDGQLLSLGDITLTSQRDIDNSGEMIANGNFTFTTPGSVNNSGKLLAGGKLDLHANNLFNAASGEINAGQNWLTVNQTLTNTGLIDGGHTLLTAETLNNIGTGRIYGDDIGVNTTTFNNLAQDGTAATLAGRERVDIGTQTLNNRDHALIYSAGDMAIGGELDANFAATGKAAVLNNHSSTIESAGDLALSASQINNINDRFSTELVTVSTTPVTEYQFRGEFYSPDEYTIYTYQDEVTIICIEGVMCHSTDGDTFNKYDYIRTIQETQIAESDPAKIIAGGNLSINADHLLNDKSQIVAGGTLGINAASVDNVEVNGERLITDVGEVAHYYRIRHKHNDSQGLDTTAYTPPTTIQTITLKPSQLVDHGDVTGNPVSIDPLTPQSTDVNIGNAGGVAADVNGTTLDPTRQTVDQPGTRLRPGQQFDVPGQSDNVVRIIGPDVRLPDNSLFKTNPAAESPYLVETDPRFTNQKKWLGSDYMQNAWPQNSDNMLKRLGDGYYEQRLIREQVIALTGQRYLDGFSNDEEQFKALMDAGVAVGKQFNLRLGVALTPEQMASLTQDIVLLVSTPVRMPDGSTQNVLVPQVYARVKPGDVDGSGALLAGKNVGLNLSGDLLNSGRIAGRDVVQLNADNLTNQAGRIQGADVALSARTDINNIGGLIQGNNSLLASAGRDINVTSTTRSASSASGANRFDRTTVDSVAGMLVQGQDGKLLLQAGRDVNLTGAQVVNSGENGQTLLNAGRDLNLNTITTSSQDALVWDADNRLTQGNSQQLGSEVVGKGAVTLSAGNDLNATAATVSAGDALTVRAGHDVTIVNGENTESVDERHKVTGSSGMLSKTTTTTRDAFDRQTAQSSSLSGDSVTVVAGHDLKVQGSSVAGTQDVTLLAGNDVTITGATERNDETHLKQEKKSGLSGTGGIGFSYGTNELKTTDTAQALTNKGSTVGSVNGNVTVGAGNNLAVVGSDLIAGKDMALSGKNVSVTAAENQNSQTHKVEQKTSGLTLALSGTAGSALNTAVETTKQARESDDSRLAALQGTKAALSGVQATQAMRMDGAKGGDPSNDNTVGVSLSYGSQSSSSTTHSEQRTSEGSGLTAGNNLNITAFGDGKAKQEGDILIQGSQLQAGKDATLNANRDINLISGENTSLLDGKNESKGGTVGVGIGVGSGGWGISVSASVNKGKGSESGNGTTHTETTVNAGNNVNIISGRDTNLIGAQVSGETVKADVGRNLTLQSQQDSDNYDSKQQNASAGGSFTFGSMSGSASVNLSKDKMHSTYESVQEQTGIFAGKGGYDITVGEHTQLDGAVIGSTADASKNKLDTGTLGFSDIENQADYKVEHQSVGVSTGGSIGKDFAGNMANNLLVGANSEGHASSTTKAAVSDGTITVRDTANQKQDVSTLSRDVENANPGLDVIFDKEREQKRLQQAQLIAEIGNQAADIARTEGQIRAMTAGKEELAKRNPPVKEPGEGATKKEWEAYNATLADTSAYKKAQTEWGTGGSIQQGMQAATAAIQGLAGGNMAQAISGAAAPYLAEQIHKLAPDEASRAMAHAVVGAVTSYASGNSAAAGAAGAVSGELMAQLVMNQLYPGKKVSELSEDQKQTISALGTLAAGLAGGLAGDSSADAIAGAQAGKNSTENNFLSANKNDALNKALDDQKAGKNLLEASQTIVRETNEDRSNNVLVDKYLKGQLTDGEKQQLAGLLNQYGYELQSVYGYSEKQAGEAIQALVNGKAFVATAADARAYNEALSYLKGYSAQSGQAALGTDALLILPGAPGAIIRGALATGGAYQTGIGIGQTVDGKYGEGALNIGLGTAAIFGGVAGQGVIKKTETGIVSPSKGTGWAESSQSIDKNAHSSIPKVTAELTDPQTGKVFTDTNQGNRPDFFLGDASKPTLINDVVQAKVINQPDKNFPNGNMATAHAEVGTIQQAYDQGMTAGRSMEMSVSGKPVCGYCLSDIKSMAEKSGLKSLTIFEEKSGDTLYWEQGMKKFTRK